MIVGLPPASPNLRRVISGHLEGVNNENAVPDPVEITIHQFNGRVATRHVPASGVLTEGDGDRGKEIVVVRTGFPARGGVLVDVGDVEGRVARSTI